ncbi:MAG: DNA-directed RNA polymerase subunit beta, partial [Alphaproteobacteria bacterium]
MAMSMTGRKRIRRRFGHIREVAPIPNLIEVQKQSYDNFLRPDLGPEERRTQGLYEALSSVFPIRDFAGKAQLEFVDYEFEAPKYDVEECRQRGLTFSAPLKVTLRLVVWDIDEETGARSIRDIKEQDVYMGDMPLMTANGTFIVNGTERVIVSQMHRSPGVFFDHDKGKTHSSGKLLYAARVIPYRGSWLDFEFDAKDLVYVRIDRRRKLPVTTMLLALDNDATAARRAELAAQNEVLPPDQAEGLTAEEILSHFYEVETYARAGDGWTAPFDPATLKPGKAAQDIRDAETGEVVVQEGARITPRT